MPFGCDNAFNDASINYANMDIMIEYWNDISDTSNENVEFIYSTPSRFINSIKSKKK